MRRLLVVSSLSVAVLTIVLTSIVIAGRQATESHLQALRTAFELGTCAEPCWHGLQFGRTTPTEALTALSKDPGIAIINSQDGKRGCLVSWLFPVESLKWQGFICTGAGQPITDFSLETPSGSSAFRLIDALLIFGLPYNVDCRVFLSPSGSGTLNIWLNYKNGIMLTAWRALPYDGPIFDPEMLIKQIDYKPTEKPMTEFIDPWPGFTADRLGPNARAKNRFCPIGQGQR